VKRILLSAALLVVFSVSLLASRVTNGVAGNILEYNADLLGGSATFTIAGWYKPATSGATQFLWGETDNTFVANENYYMAILNTNVLQVAVKHSGSGLATTTSNTITSGAWQHFAYVSSGAASRTPYLNGTAGSTDTSSWAATGLAIFSIGDIVYNSGMSFSSAPSNGKFGQWAIWNTALSGSDITALNGGACPSAVQSGSLTGYWVLGGTTSPEPDSTAGGHNLIINGTVTGDTGDLPPVTCGSTPTCMGLLLGVGCDHVPVSAAMRQVIYSRSR